VRAIQDIQAAEDLTDLRQRLQMMSQLLAMGQVKPDRRPLVEYVRRTLEARIEELESDAQEEN
jgi:hypothetical protein